MCYFCKAASTVLDMLWQEPELREHFHHLGYELSDLGAQIHEVFVPAYRSVKDQLDAPALLMLEAQVTQDLLEPFYDRPGFRQIWDEWNQETRDEFIREQSEVQLAQLLLRFYTDEFADAYKAAHVAHSR